MGMNMTTSSFYVISALFFPNSHYYSYQKIHSFIINTQLTVYPIQYTVSPKTKVPFIFQLFKTS